MTDKPKNTLYSKSEGTYRFKFERKAWGVDIPAYVYDLWLPLLGIDVVGLYGFYSRLAREGELKGMSQRDIARACRVSPNTTPKMNDILEQSKFIRVEKPKGWEIIAHFTTTIVVLDPPREVTQADIDRLRPDPDRYQKWQYIPVATWLFEQENEIRTNLLETLPSITDDTAKYHDSSLASNANLDPSYIEPSDNSKTSITPAAAATPSWDPNIETVSDEEEAQERTALSLLIAMAYPKKPSYLTETQEIQLSRPVTAIIDVAISVKLPSPNELYETRSLFKKFCKWAIEQQKAYASKSNNANVRASKTNIVNHICGYNRADGWLWYEEQNKNFDEDQEFDFSGFENHEEE